MKWEHHIPGKGPLEAFSTLARELSQWEELNRSQLPTSLFGGKTRRLHTEM